MIVDYLETVEMIDPGTIPIGGTKPGQITEALKEKPQSFLEKKKNDRIGSSEKEKN